MAILLIAIFLLWFYSVYSFAKWRLDVTSQKGIVLINVLQDPPTNLYLRVTAAIILALILYIIS